jgi:hypothetical protein
MRYPLPVAVPTMQNKCQGIAALALNERIFFEEEK